MKIIILITSLAFSTTIFAESGHGHSHAHGHGHSHGAPAKEIKIDDKEAEKIARAKKLAGIGRLPKNSQKTATRVFFAKHQFKKTKKLKQLAEIRYQSEDSAIDRIFACRIKINLK